MILEKRNANLQPFLFHFLVMEREEYTYASGEEDKLSQDLQCAVCVQPLIEPTMHTGCQRMYCASCLAPLAQCPECRGDLKDKLNSVVPRFISNTLGSLRVICRQCNAVMERSTLQAHLQQCPTSASCLPSLMILLCLYTFL